MVMVGENRAASDNVYFCLKSHQVSEQAVLGHFVVADFRQVEHERLESRTAVRKQTEHGIHHVLSLLEIVTMATFRWHGVGREGGEVVDVPEHTERGKESTKLRIENHDCTNRAYRITSYFEE